ncbi:ATP-grasp domain-containing protein [Lysobacter sp. CA199]|uniref:ATP-grasp domain-containing protein n=1 Tax=Lysobacter sp. CA199 TaxID=3455608 RepID=UPI003F8D6DDE
MPASNTATPTDLSPDTASSGLGSVASSHPAEPLRFDPALSIALVTSKVHPEVDPDDAGLVDALRAHGIETTACMWNDPSVDWSAFDALLVRSTWDYFQHYTQFLAWYAHIESLGAVIVNPLPLLIWNSDKRYLLDLAAQDVPIIPTVLARGGELSTALAAMSGEVVVKPSVSGGAWHTVRGCIGSAPFEQALAALPRELDYLVQPFMPQIVEQGEWSLLFFGGVYSHAVLKKPGADDYRVQTYFGGTSDPTAPTPQILASARRALQAVAELGYRDQAYVRVDGVVADGVFRIMELEFIEPFLHFAVHPPAAPLFAAQLARRWQALRAQAAAIAQD